MLDDVTRSFVARFNLVAHSVTCHATAILYPRYSSGWTEPTARNSLPKERRPDEYSPLSAQQVRGRIGATIRTEYCKLGRPAVVIRSFAGSETRPFGYCRTGTKIGIQYVIKFSGVSTRHPQGGRYSSDPVRFSDRDDFIEGHRTAPILD